MHKGWARLQLELDLAAEPIGGTLTDDREVTTPFHGWLQLTEAIEAARTAVGTHEAKPGGLQAKAEGASKPTR